MPHLRHTDGCHSPSPPQDQGRPRAVESLSRSRGPPSRPVASRPRGLVGTLRARSLAHALGSVRSVTGVCVCVRASAGVDPAWPSARGRRAILGRSAPCVWWPCACHEGRREFSTDSWRMCGDVFRRSFSAKKYSVSIIEPGKERRS